MVPTTLVLYDGVCGLCDGFIQFVLRRDRRARIAFATLQGELARRVLPAGGYDPADLDTVVVIAGWNGPEPRVLSRSRAVLHAVEQLGGLWSAAAVAGRAVPVALADAIYRLVARHRYRWFGRYDACPLPRAEWRDRFLE